MTDEIVYLGRNNTNKITVYQTSGGVDAPFDFTNATRATVECFSLGIIADTSSNSNFITLSSDTGNVTFSFGSVSVDSAFHDISLKSTLTIYDATNTNGLTVLHQDAHDLSFKFLVG